MTFSLVRLQNCSYLFNCLSMWRGIKSRHCIHVISTPLSLRQRTTSDGKAGFIPRREAITQDNLIQGLFTPSYMRVCEPSTLKFFLRYIGVSSYRTLCVPTAICTTLDTFIFHIILVLTLSNMSHADFCLMWQLYRLFGYCFLYNTVFFSNNV
jgi:hypothetical protein